jgi:DNA polymerase III subunit epsilon
MSLAETLQLNTPLVCVDLETTGLAPKRDRIVQIGIVKLYPDGKVTEWESLVQPTIPIPAEVTAIHGLTDADVKDSPTFKTLAPKLAAGFANVDFCGFNCRFDLAFLDAEFARAGVRNPLTQARVVDSFRIFQHQEPRGLTAAYKFYLGETRVGGHNALLDVKDTLRVLAAQLARYDDLPKTVEGLHVLFNETPQDGCLDPEGKIAWRGNDAAINFGKHMGTPLKDLDRGYLQWIIKGDFNPAVKKIVEAALAGQFPKKEAA